MYSYGYGTTYSSAYTYVSALGILLLIAIIAALVFSVVLYVKFIKTDRDKKILLTKPRELSSFLRFDTLIIDKVLSYIYLLSALMVAFIDLAFVLASITQGFFSFVSALIVGAIAFVFLELCLRLLFEFRMLYVVTARNTKDIKDMLNTKNSVALPPVQGMPASKVSEPVVEPEIVEPEERTATPTASSEGTSEASSKKVCSNCSSENAADAAYCSDCGSKLD